MAEIEIPSIVKELARQEGKEPWSWFVAPDHVTIVYMDGHKVRYERAIKTETPAAAAIKPVAEPAPKQTKAASRTSKKK